MDDELNSSLESSHQLLSHLSVAGGQGSARSSISGSVASSECFDSSVGSDLLQELDDDLDVAQDDGVPESNNKDQTAPKNGSSHWSDRFWWQFAPKPAFGTPAKRAKTAGGGAAQAGQNYGSGQIIENDFVQPLDPRLEPIKILPSNYHWLDSIANMEENPKDVFPFAGKEEPEVLFPPETRAVDMFLELFGPASEIWMDATNQKGRERSVKNKKLGSSKPWSVSTFLAFVAAILWMDVEPKSEIAQYWSRDRDQSSHFIRRKLSAVAGLSFRKFSEILRSTRLYNASEAQFKGISNRSSRTFDNQHKCRPFLSQLYETFQKFRLPGRCISIDESMMKFTGLCAFVQTIIRKPIKHGLKFFYLSDSKDGYVYNGLLYSGELMPYREEMGAVFAYVWNLMSGVLTAFGSFLDKGHILFLDRYFTSVPLLYALYHRKTYGVGTIRRDRKNVPKWNVVMEAGGSLPRGSGVAAVNRKRKKVDLLSKTLLPWGAVRFKRDNMNILRHLVWSDSKRTSGKITINLKQKRDLDGGVVFMENVHILYNHPTVATQLTTCVRRNKKARGEVKLQQPLIARVFDDNMGGVDLCDQLIAAHRRHLRTYVWFVGILIRGIHLCCSNVYANMSRRGNKIPMRELKMQIAKGIFAKISEDMSNRPVPWYCRSYTSFEVEEGKTGKHHKNVVDDTPLLSVPAHFPKRLPGKRRKMCKECPKGKKVVYICSLCGVGLHIKCFETWHRKRNLVC